MDRLTTRDVDNYVNTKHKAGRAYNTIRGDLWFLHRMLEVAKIYGLIEKVPHFRVPPERPTSIVALTSDEAVRFSDVATNLSQQRHAVLLKLYLRTGLRYGEGVSLYPADFDLRSQQPTVWVRRTWTKKYGYGPPKGEQDRVVPVVPELAAEIDALLCERGLSPKSTTEHPFCADGSRPYE